VSIIGSTNIRYSGDQTRDTKESVLDRIVDVSPMDTPLLFMATRGERPRNIKHEWVTDSLGAWPSSSGTYVRGEGEDFTPEAPTDRVVMFNRTHVWGHAWSVSETQEAVSLHGIESEYNYQAAKFSRQTVREFDWILHNSNITADAAGPNAGSAGQKRKMGGLIEQIQENAAGNNTFISEGTLATIQRSYNNSVASGENNIDELKENMRTMWDRGGIVNGRVIALVGSTVKEAFSNNFAPVSATASASIYRRNIGTGESTRIVLSVDYVETDFGLIYFVLDRSVPSGNAVLFAPEFFHVNVLRDITKYELAKVGPSYMGAVEGEMTCSLLAPSTASLLTGIA